MCLTEVGFMHRYIFLSLVEIQPKRVATSRYLSAIFMLSCTHTKTLVLSLYVPQKEPISTGLVILHKQAFQGGMGGRFVGVTESQQLFNNKHTPTFRGVC